jgi:hypothetical protein
MRYKLYLPLTKNIKKYSINQMSENVIKTNKFDIIRQSSDILLIGKVRYLKYLIIEYPGDFIYINKSFRDISNLERLNSCRSFYNELHTAKQRKY